MRVIEIHEYQDTWPRDYQNESELLMLILADLNPTIHHIGSTAVIGLAAKPVIDILIETRCVADLDLYDDAMSGIGYSAKGAFGIPGRRFFLKGEENRSHHVHAFSADDSNIGRHIAFRDYLKAHPEIAEEYATLKKLFYFQYLANYKLAVLVFNIVPYLALKIII